MWREAWKYQDRAYRYCLLDIGHAWEALAMAARALGCDTFTNGCFADDELTRLCRFSEDEWPMVTIAIQGPPSDSGRDEKVWLGGSANSLSAEPMNYRSIDRVHAATKISRCSETVSAPRAPASGFAQFGRVARTRRSALDFEGGSRSITLAQLSAILAAASRPFFADFADAPFVQLYLYVHRVDGLPPGVYRNLEPIKLGDQRVAAAGLSLGQDLAGNACVAFSMIADLDRATRVHGDRGYRYAHFEAGAIGQRLYLAAEALGLRATGIGAFFDDEVHRYLNLSPEQLTIASSMRAGPAKFNQELCNRVLGCAG